MMGRDHLLSGLLVGLAGTDVLAHALGHASLQPSQAAIAALICGGWALAPDIDEPGSSISRVCGPVSRAVAVVTRRVCGGHRVASHSLAAALAVGLGTAYLSRFALTLPVIVFLAALLTVRLMRLARRGSLLALAIPVAAGWATWRLENGAWLGGGHGSAWWWLPWVCAAGAATHLVGDLITAGGIPPLWPWRHRVAIPLFGRTDSAREHALGLVLGLAVLGATWVWVIAPLTH